MSETRKLLNLDAVLRDWPQPEAPLKETSLASDPWPEHFEDRLRHGLVESSFCALSDEELLVAPLGQSAGEGSISKGLEDVRGQAQGTPIAKGNAMTTPVNRERDRKSLQDLAKLARGPLSGQLPGPPESRGAPSREQNMPRAAGREREDSGLIDLARALREDAAPPPQGRSTLRAAMSALDDDAHSEAIPHLLLAEVRQPAPSIPTIDALAAARVLTGTGQRVPATTGRSRASLLVLGGLFVAVTATLGGILASKTSPLNTGPTAVTTLPKDSLAAPVLAEGAHASALPPVAESLVGTHALPETTTDSVVTPKRPAALVAPILQIAKAVPVPKAEVTTLSAKDLPTSSQESGLGKAMGAAVGENGDVVQVAPAAGPGGLQFSAGSVPQKPSQGAVTGAIGVALPGARACLGPDDPVSRASITFVSAGTVESVTVSGGAAGKPAEACIRSALSKAKVTPFAEPTFSATVTVRH